MSRESAFGAAFTGDQSFAQRISEYNRRAQARRWAEFPGNPSYEEWLEAHAVDKHDLESRILDLEIENHDLRSELDAWAHWAEDMP